MPTDAERIKELEFELAQYKVNGQIGLYYELNRLINETLELSKSMSLRSLISDGEKGDKKFERMQALIKAAKEHAVDMEEIKSKLGLSGDRDKDNQRKPFIDTLADKRE